ncbi:hypothetical protein [Marinagarivorans cellulosilyticus]|uniref:Alginate export domain-containing protein n=1 Tax=Marinagarivorans cellulosilyticus TaxID=2721545 RepID=A0AAN2BM70_9GAMM|nr:hypothetical protein [Marinagarivorans cellulosilyticus]BCD99844.1 hypothetical protein MARGE09_P4046 [Marinagarivorans cellulosilyticus]
MIVKSLIGLSLTSGLFCLPAVADDVPSNADSDALTTDEAAPDNPNGVDSRTHSEKWKEGYTISPVMLDSENSSGSSLGLKYDFSRTYKFDGSDATVGDDQITPRQIDEAIYGPYWFTKYRVNGVWTPDEIENPLATSNAKLKVGWGRFQKGYEFGASGIGGFEGDQDFSNRQNLYGLELYLFSSFSENDNGTFADISVNFEQIDASDDKNRAVLTDVSEFDRLSGEFTFSYKLEGNFASKTSITSMQFNYRYFAEQDAPDAIEATGLDTYKLATYLIKFEKGLYVAYSTGALPFDKIDDRVFEVGFSQTLFK